MLQPITNYWDTAVPEYSFNMINFLSGSKMNHERWTVGLIHAGKTTVSFDGGPSERCSRQKGNREPRVERSFVLNVKKGTY